MFHIQKLLNIHHNSCKNATPDFVSGDSTRCILTKDLSNIKTENVTPKIRSLGMRQKLFSGFKPSHIMTRSWRTKMAFLLIVCAVVSSVATYAALNETPPFGSNPDIVIWLLNIDLVILLLLVSLIARRVVGLWSGRKRKIAGSHLHVRLVYIFSILAAVPTVIMTVFSAFFFHYGVQAWFSQRVQTAVNESSAVSKAYLEEHMQVIRADTMAMANDLDRQADSLVFNPSVFGKVMDTQTMLRNLSEAIVFRQGGDVLARSGLTFALEYETVPSYALEDAKSGEVVLMTGENKDRVRALVKLNNFDNTYLFVGRLIDPQVLLHLNTTQEAVDDYADLKAKFSGLQITVTMIFVVVGLLVLFAAIWFGLILARKLVRPIGELISASDRVRGGDLSVRVEEFKDLEEFDYLAKSFNRMTEQIQEQQTELIEANRQIDQRRRLIETVLAGVSSGVIGLDAQLRINLANYSAAEFLGIPAHELTGRSIIDVLPDLAEPVAQAQANKRSGKNARAEISYLDGKGNRRIFLFSMVRESSDDIQSGLILTFDDITELQSAQRKAAWSDVARRIAHEIKNPLTPIQLSAERLKRKYLGQITQDQDTFVQCIETIVRHVSDIGRMVNEFSSFARMPEPVFKQENLYAVLRDCMVLPMQSERDITFTLNYDESLTDEATLLLDLDAQQMRQAMTNILQNAADSIHMRPSAKAQDKGQVDILVGKHGEEEIFIAITDNGVGFPKDEALANLTEPYVTHKPKGTGLGLAIVKKIMEDHNGQIILGDPSWLRDCKKWNDLGGACVIFLLPSLQESSQNNNRKVA